MRCSARAVAAAALALAVALGSAWGGAAPARAAALSTGAFRVTAPGAPWKRSPDLDPPGRLSFEISDPKVTTANLRVECLGTRATDAAAATDELLARERATVEYDARGSSAVERGPFEPDSLSAGGLAWRGFHVHVKTGERAGDVWRWVAVHPDFPRRRQAYLVSLDEQTLPGARATARDGDARALLRSLAPAGRGLAGGLADAYLDARASAFAARVDTTTRLCWVRDAEDAQRPFVGVARGLAGEGDFFQTVEAVPRDSVVDPASPDYGVGFDRNGDGRIDLMVLNRGIAAARGARMIPVVAVLADDDFDGHVDGCVLETGDADQDGRVDHRLLVLDTNHDGRADRAVRFGDDVSDPSNARAPVKDGVVEDGIVGNKIRELDFTVSWREAEALLARWNRALAACPR